MHVNHHTGMGGDFMQGQFPYGVNFAAGNFTDVTEKTVGKFADHLNCSALHGLVDPELQDQFCLTEKRVEPQVSLTTQRDPSATLYR